MQLVRRHVDAQQMGRFSGNLQAQQPCHHQRRPWGTLRWLEYLSKRSWPCIAGGHNFGPLSAMCWEAQCPACWAFHFSTTGWRSALVGPLMQSRARQFCWTPWIVDTVSVGYAAFAVTKELTCFLCVAPLQKHAAIKSSGCSVNLRFKSAVTYSKKDFAFPTLFRVQQVHMAAILYINGSCLTIR